MEYYPSPFQDGTFQTSINFEYPETSSLQKYIHSAEKDLSLINPYTISYNSTLKSREINPDDIKLPNGINFVALRETFLSEAPFVKHFNRIFWKKWVDTRQFQVILSQFLSLVLECVNEEGVFNVKQLYSIVDHPSLHQLNYTSFSKFNQLKKSKNIEDLTELFSSPEDLFQTSMKSKVRAATSPSLSRTNRMKIELETEWKYRPIVEKLAVNVAELLLMNRNIGGEVFSNEDEEKESKKKKEKKGSGHSSENNNKNSASKKQSINMRGKNGESKQHDILFYHLPEILTYMLVQALLANSPKLSKLFYSIRFRVILYNWLNENIHGIKVNNHELDNYHLSEYYKVNNSIALKESLKDKDTKDSSNNNTFQPESKVKREKKIENITWILKDSFDHPIYVIDLDSKLKKPSQSKKSKTLSSKTFNFTATSASFQSATQERTIIDINSEIINQLNMDHVEGNEGIEDFNILFNSHSNLLPSLTKNSSKRNSTRNSINLTHSGSTSSINTPLLKSAPILMNNSSSANLTNTSSSVSLFNDPNNASNHSVTIKDSTIDLSNDDLLNQLGIKCQTQAQQVKLYPKLSAAQSYFSMGNSPLIQIYMNLGRLTLADNKNVIMATSLTNDSSLLSYTQIDPPYQCATKSNVLLSHLATSPLVSLNHQSEANEKKHNDKYRFKKVYPNELKQTINTSEIARRNILSNFKHLNAKEREEQLKSKQLLKIQLDILEKKPVSQKKLLQALQNSTTISSSSNPNAAHTNTVELPSSHLNQSNIENNLSGNSLSFPSVSQFDVED